MSRFSVSKPGEKEGEVIHIAWGNDHAIGLFFQMLLETEGDEIALADEDSMFTGLNFESLRSLVINNIPSGTDMKYVHRSLAEILEGKI